MTHQNTIVRIYFYSIGLILFAFGISLTISANIGISPWDAVSVGLYETYGFSIGTWLNLIYACLILTGAWLSSERPRIDIALVSLSMGMMIDAFYSLIQHALLFITAAPIILYAFGLLFIAIGCGTYLVSDYSPTAIDYVMLCMQKRFSINITKAMMVCQVIGLICAFLCQGPIGYGTFIATLLYGPLIGMGHIVARRLYRNITLS